MAQSEIVVIIGPLVIGVIAGATLVKILTKYKVSPIVLGMKFMYTVISETKRMLLMAKGSCISDDDAEELALLIAVNIVDQIMDGFDGTISPRMKNSIISLVESGVVDSHTVDEAITQAYAFVEKKVLRADRERLKDASRIVTRAVSRFLDEDSGND